MAAEHVVQVWPMQVWPELHCVLVQQLPGTHVLETAPAEQQKSAGLVPEQVVLTGLHAAETQVPGAPPSTAVSQMWPAP